jgi:hypothetical protein
MGIFLVGWRYLLLLSLKKAIELTVIQLSSGIPVMIAVFKSFYSHSFIEFLLENNEMDNRSSSTRVFWQDKSQRCIP